MRGPGEAAQQGGPVPGNDDPHKMTEVDADGREWTFDPATGELTPGDVAHPPKKKPRKRRPRGPAVTSPLEGPVREGGRVSHALGTVLGLAWIVLLCWIVLDCG